VTLQIIDQVRGTCSKKSRALPPLQETKEIDTEAPGRTDITGSRRLVRELSHTIASVGEKLLNFDIAVFVLLLPYLSVANKTSIAAQPHVRMNHHPIWAI
jgi:hypothetical protein